MLKEGNIILRPLYDNDANVLAQLANNKKIWDNIRDFLPSPYVIDDANHFIKLTQKENPQMTFAIGYDSQFCGVIGLLGQSDVYKRTAEIGYWIGEPYWNKGIATVSVKLLTEYGFNKLDFIRIHTGVFEYNIGSMKVLKKSEYSKDGVFKKSILKNGQIFDEHRFSKTK
ncbi:MAG TPA: GNAT family protein [Chitinophagaceae bacterium]|nr:GNAT family protein [Chitinophagaceae bacterium]